MTVKETILKILDPLMPGSSTTPDNPVDILKADHKNVKQLFEDFKKSDITEAEKRKLAATIINDLTVHQTIEEELIYPALKKVVPEKSAIIESYVEHHLVIKLLDEMKAAAISIDELTARVKVVTELVEQHIKEEESQMLPKLSEAVYDMEALGRQMLARKKELMKSEKSASKTVANAKAATADKPKAATASKATAAKPKTVKKPVASKRADTVTKTKSTKVKAAKAAVSTKTKGPAAKKAGKQKASMTAAKGKKTKGRSK